MAPWGVSLIVASSENSTTAANLCRAASRRRSSFDRGRLIRGWNQIDSAEDFIEKAASQSSLGGRPYQIRCDGLTLTTNRWLRDELTRYRDPPSPGPPPEGDGPH